MTSARLRHPLRFLLLALVLGPAFAWSVAGATELLPWMDSPEFDLFLGPPAETTVGFALTTALVAWLLRRRIASATRLAALALAAGATWLGGPLFMFFFLFCGLPAELPDMVTEQGWRTLFELPLGLLAAMLLGALFAPFLLPVTLPLGWVSILLLRWASGGVVEVDRPRRRRPVHVGGMQGS